MSGEMENLIRLHALDPAFGFLHCHNYNFPALAWDLLEPFRPGFCDMLVVSLFSHHQFRKEHFLFSPDSVHLSPEGRKIFFNAWEMKRKHQFMLANKTHKWQDVWDSHVMTWLNFLSLGVTPSFFKLP